MLPLPTPSDTGEKDVEAAITDIILLTEDENMGAEMETRTTA